MRCAAQGAELAPAGTSARSGGPVLDAVTLLARLITTLHDDAGNVAVPGLATADEPTVDYAEADFRADSSLLDGTVLAGEGSIAGRLWTKPAIAVIGLDAPSVAHASNTLTPRATAKLSVRLAPGQGPAAARAALRPHVASRAPGGEPSPTRPPGRRAGPGGPGSAPSRTAPTSASPMRYPMSSLSNET